MLKFIAIAVVVALAAVLVIAATRPDVFRVQRSIVIQAPPERIYPLINDLHRFNDWSPYIGRDPAMQQTYSGPDSGIGAQYGWSGNSKVGKGSFAITATQAPSAVTMQLDMLTPFAAHNVVEFTLQSAGTATTVTWSMHGPNAYVARLMGLFINMDQMVGGDFERGLLSLKSLAEQ